MLLRSYQFQLVFPHEKYVHTAKKNRLKRNLQFSKKNAINLIIIIILFCFQTFKIIKN